MEPLHDHVALVLVELLGLDQHVLAHADLAEVVEQRRVLDLGQVVGGEAQVAVAAAVEAIGGPGQAQGQGRDPLGVARRRREEENTLLMRFGKVFQQTYTRFLDLQKAEAQAKEAKVEAALERVRSQAMAMRQSADLLDIVVTMRNEFTRLGHEAHYFWYMRWLPDKYEKAMTSGDGTRIGMIMELPRHMHGEIPLLSKWEKSDEPAIVYAMDVEAAINYVDKMVALGDFKLVDHNAPTHDDIRHINGLTFIMARTMHGEIGYSLPGVVSHPPADDIKTLVRFAGVFDLAYRRFEDLKLAEQKNRETEIELALEKVRSRNHPTLEKEPAEEQATYCEEDRALTMDCFENSARKRQ